MEKNWNVVDVHSRSITHSTKECSDYLWSLQIKSIDQKYKENIFILYYKTSASKKTPFGSQQEEYV